MSSFMELVVVSSFSDIEAECSSNLDKTSLLLLLSSLLSMFLIEERMDSFRLILSKVRCSSASSLELVLPRLTSKALKTSFSSLMVFGLDISPLMELRLELS